MNWVQKIHPVMAQSQTNWKLIWPTQKLATAQTTSYWIEFVLWKSQSCSMAQLSNCAFFLLYWIESCCGPIGGQSDLLINSNCAIHQFLNWIWKIPSCDGAISDWLEVDLTNTSILTVKYTSCWVGYGKVHPVMPQSQTDWRSIWSTHQITTAQSTSSWIEYGKVHPVMA